MHELATVAPAFVEMAHRIVWCSAASVDPRRRPWSRILHPIWRWDGGRLEGWIATMPTALKRAHLEASPHLSLCYWSPNHDHCIAECRASLRLDDDTRAMVWDAFRNAPEPVGYDPAIIPGWDEPTAESFAALRVDPWRLRVFPGTMLLEQRGEVLTWRA